MLLADANCVLIDHLGWSLWPVILLTSSGVQPASIKDACGILFEAVKCVKGGFNPNSPTFSSSFLKFVLNPSSVNRALSWSCTIVFDE